jgi:hypothetical protein
MCKPVIACRSVFRSPDSSPVLDLVMLISGELRHILELAFAATFMYCLWVQCLCFESGDLLIELDGSGKVLAGKLTS